MFSEIFRFELKYRRARAATYIYFGIMLLMCFLSVTTEIVQVGNGVGQVKENAPTVINQLMMILGVFFTLITSAVMGVAVLRDFEHNTEAILFSTPMKKSSYLLGRFFGSFLVLVLISCGMWMGFMLGDLMWWREADKMGPFNLMTYLQPFFIFIVPNLFVTGALLFMSGTLSRKSIVIYTQGILLLVLYLASQSLLRDLDQKQIAALLDPFGLRAFSFTTQYWTPAERNSLVVPLDGYVLYNRLLWIGVGLLALIVTYFGFSFNVVRGALIRRKAAPEQFRIVRPEQVHIPAATQIVNTRTHIQQLFRLTWFYASSVAREIPFIGIVISGLLLLLLNSINMNELYGTSSYPTTYNVVNLIQGSFSLFFLIIVVFYTGELVWKERAVNINLIVDTTPIPDFITLVAKFIGLTFLYVGLMLVLTLCGMGIQAAYGYYKFEPAVYFSTLFTEALAFQVLYTLLALFIQVMVNNKFLGYAITVVFFIFVQVMGNIGLEHPLFQFGSGSLDTYSDMNVHGHFVMPFSWLQVYWMAFAAVLLGVAVIFAPRGTESLIHLRWKVGKLRLNRQLTLYLGAFAVIFISSGFFVYYNNNILNEYRAKKAAQKRQADYEKTLKQFEYLAQPRIVDTQLKVEIYPDRRDFTAEGYYWLKNKTSAPIADVHIQLNPNPAIKVEKLSFDRKFTANEQYKDFRYTIYTLDPPLAAGDSVRMDFKETYDTRGFVATGSNTNIVYNGTFFNNQYFPGLGYSEAFELGDDNERKDNGLKVKERMLPREDPRGLSQSLFGDDADHIRFDITVGTSDDQIAIAPGYLQKEWTENNRRYFHYRMDAPMCDFYSIISARYAVKRDKYNDINLEIYYHPGHEYNLDRMMDGMKDALAYYEKNFSPYQYRQVRIMEFPRYSNFAQSFANTIPYSEGIGFIAKIDNPEKDIDYVYYVTAHEVAHQWWGHQVMEAGVQGNAMLSESMSQYSALMVLKHKLTPEIIERYLKYELDRYLSGRSFERKKEQPLEKVEGQGYIHYQKASLVFYALQDYISEDSVNAAFRRYNKTWRFRDAPYPTSADLLKEIRKVTPDSLQYLIHDMFETITLFENKTEEATYKELSKEQWEVKLKVSAEKLRADSTGMETNIPINDWIDIGVYGKDDKGKDKLIYLKKHHITKKDNEFAILVKEKPRKAGIDPLHKLIDRHSSDNTKGLVQK
ncbi:MAG: aminopeptidase [Cyclobacteriaceae bacterium]|nr:aminopeptidase [Cyclobacteriaceae bacterium]